MSESQPRMSRREMRAKGLLAPVLDGESPFDDLTPTAEISLKRLTRKQMRELEEARRAQESGEGAVDEDPQETAEDVSQDSEPAEAGVEADEAAEEADEAAAGEAVLPARASVFERFENADETAAAQAETKISPAIEDGVAEAELGESELAAAEGDSGEGVEGQDDSTFEPSSLKAPLLERLRAENQEAEEAQLQAAGLAADEAESTLVDAGADAPAGTDADASSVGDAVEALPEVEKNGGDDSAESAGYEAELGEVIEDEQPRNWLMMLVAILIGVLVGVALGVLLKRVISAGEVSPVIDALGLGGFNRL